MDTSLLEEVPEAFTGKVGFSDGVLYIAESVQFEPAILSFLSLAERKGVTDFVWMRDDELNAKIRTLPAVKGLKTDSAIINYAKSLIQTAYEQSASDIHLTDTGTQTVIRMRRMGLVRDYTVMPGETGRRLIRAFYQILGQDGQGEFAPMVRQDARIVQRQYLPPNVYSVRVHTEPIEAVEAPNGISSYMALRLLYDSVTVTGTVRERLMALGYSKRDADKIHLLTQRTGLIVISGRQGSGKSTALRHIMEGQAEEFPEKNYVTIEDPSEYPMRNVKQVHIPLGDREEMKKALFGFLRMDANKLMPGEVRYPEAAEMVLEATLTGHAVWTTIHALDAFEIITRLRNLLIKSYPGDPLDTLCNYKVVAGLIHQCLIPTLCPHCKVPLQEYLTRQNQQERAHILPKDVYARLLTVVKNMDHVHVRGSGCEHCKKQGFAGRRLAVEVVVTDAALMKLIRDGKHDEARAYWKEELGGRSYMDHAIEMIANGEADPLQTELELGAPLNISKAIQDLAYGED